MLSSAETPRPLPPAKARRATMLKLSSTPPPAYNSSFTFPSRRQSRHQDMLGEPTFHMIGWDGDSAPSPSSPPLAEELLVTVDERGPCSFDDMMTCLPLSSSQNSTLVPSPRTCIRILHLSSRNMTLCYLNFPILLHLLLMVHHICCLGL